MKNICLVLSPVLLAFLSCNTSSEQTKKSTVIDSTIQTTKIATQPVTDSLVTDTTLSVNINGAMYSTVVAHDRFDNDGKLYSDDDEPSIPLTISISKAGSVGVIFKKKFKQNEYKFFKNSDVQLSNSGKLFLTLTENNGGSGFSAIMYEVRIDKVGKLEFLQIMEYGELSRMAFSKSETKVLRLAGDWNFDENETHFEEHRQRILKYVLEGGQYTELKFGETKYKYSSESDMKDVINEIKTKEPLAFEDFNLNDYSFDGQ